MSVTITIQNNRQYIDAHCPELVQVETYPAEEYSQEMTFKNYPCELNVANGNFCRIIDSLGGLGIDIDQGEGFINPNLIIAMLKQRKPSIFTREDNKEGNFYSCGITTDQASRYYFTLLQIANEALRRKETLIWY